MDEGEIERYWTIARSQARITSMPGYFGPTTLEMLAPSAWSFGATPEQADELLALVLDGTKTATAGALADYQPDGDSAAEPLPEPGTLSILLDGAGHPRALIEATHVAVVRFDQVDEEHAYLEGEGDRSLGHWRQVHERFFAETSTDGRPHSPDMPVVLERFRVLHRA